MNTLDFIVLFGTLGFIVTYGVYSTRNTNSIEGYLRGDNNMKWGTIGLSVMATQASAITFISTSGQAYESGMGFIQNYFGLPIALVIVAFVFIPLYYKLKIYTAYEFLESRFDRKTRLLGAFLFLVQRGLAAGITIYAPAIVLSTILGWSLTWTIILVGVLVIIYTVSGGTKAVSVTQKHQMAVIFIGMVVAFGYILYYLSPFVNFTEALNIAGRLDKLNAIDFSFDFGKRYTVWTGILGGMFLALSYFGTDQSQVARYIGGKNTSESKMGLMFNAVLKIPMQFFILLTGVFIYVFYIFYQPPIHFIQTSLERVAESNQLDNFNRIEKKYQTYLNDREIAALTLKDALKIEDKALIDRTGKILSQANANVIKTREEVKNMIVLVDSSIKTKDSDYVFLTFILNYLPAGLIGLLIAVIFSAAMSSTSSEINALASTTTIDFYKTIINKNATNKQSLNVSRLLTVIWGFMAIIFAFLASRSENLIEMVNILGSLFYGTILGIFLVAFFVKFTKGNAVFIAAIISQSIVLVLFNIIDISYLWYNVIGCGLTILLGIVLQIIIKK